MEKLNQQNGRYAEEFTTEVLISQGWNILERNFRRPGTEIDIIAEKEETLVFLEVKYRKHPANTASALEALMSYRKQKALTRGMMLYLGQQEKVWKNMRVDLAVVTKKSPASKPGFQYFVSVL